ncbi:2Fe-2S iron-sulfur cluster binding domain-containing protein [Desulfotomaculum arcticum]|uniref:2Fe-2S iron-sulfur cluster binding domain-containing protein n=1 Tax=Desulfotruncus arcticus DSM 17038 TaxID=1121424 RepID=A0A1I2Q6V6_9FIRM|nr:(2Fe-2S)-binding protein [Desulfotruncus arcticus]SFG21546.1 2Fe-2S iron-sulfur cluster binding domain-containing protein [Desulfotomaculum arcticum] [Desulfotruncus arcticus DSM 17038]
MRISEHPILEFPKKREVTFTFEGQVLTGLEGEPIAAALHANGIKVLRHSHKDHRARGFFCAIGNCSSCYMEVNGEPNVRVCVEELKEGMIVNRQEDKGKYTRR